MPSRKSRSNSSSPPGSKNHQILQQLGRAVLAYALKKLAEHQQARSEPLGHARSRSRDRSNSVRSHRDVPRNDDGELQTVITQMAIGALIGGVRRLIKRRRERKRAAAAATTTDVNNASRTTRSKTLYHPAVTIDPELSASLDFATSELCGAIEILRNIADASPRPLQHPTHDCAVRDAVVAEADRLTTSLTRLQMSIFNMQNQHPALEAPGKVGERRGQGQGRETRVGGMVAEDVEGRRTKPGEQNREVERRRWPQSERSAERRQGGWEEGHSHHKGYRIGRRASPLENACRMRHRSYQRLNDQLQVPAWPGPWDEGLHRLHRRRRGHGYVVDEPLSTGRELRRSRIGAYDEEQTPCRYRVDPVIVS
ncbi:hypothetical protein VTJ83DRAFT_1429 [Remersonia thermophila]|uniref:Uncharacterized protein n=1 Tax=Remersonia thermophila TaxID=72144 RepID=A0ABR4DP60_9PEZI